MIVAAKGVCSPEGTNDMWLPTSSHRQFDGSPSFVSNNIKASSELKNFFIYCAIIIPYWYGVVMKPFAVDFFCVAFKIVVHRRDQQVWGERYHRYRDFVFWTNNPLITFHISLWYFVSIRIQCHISFIDATNKPDVAMLNNTRGYQMIYDFTPHPMDNLMAVQVLFPIIQKQAVSWRKKLSIGQLFCIDGVLKTSCCWFLLFKIVVHRRDQQVRGERYHRYRDFVFCTNNPLITFHISFWYFVSIRIQSHISFIGATNKPYVAMIKNTRGYQWYMTSYLIPWTIWWQSKFCFQ